ncbi:hypothetical protein QBC47DRAFT_407093 [Echria macrotheca]|uniref:Uncharacterized protein n=1 Tax=Echria macrotheca TaxID=438768 RepID=A0AAJ0B2E8_9PEZI|nr:hypothetical protein QBC47DRAFT_407093 [Echria macrotheca]
MLSLSTSSPSRLLLSFFLLFLVGSVSAQYTTASDGDLCYDPDSESTTTISTKSYSNSTVTKTKSYSSGITGSATLSSSPTVVKTGAPTTTAATGGVGALAPEVIMGLVAAFVAVGGPLVGMMFVF